MNLQQKAEALLALHHADKMLILPNITTPIGARILAERGFGAVATPSAGIAQQLGVKDGENVPFDVLLYILKQIVDATDLPVTADIERGYADDLDGLAQNVAALLDIGVVGINIEDSLDVGLRDVDEQVKRIKTVRSVCETRGVHMVINARVDVFITNLGDGKKLSETEKIGISIERAAAYRAAGADVIYPIGAKHESTVASLVDGIDLPINVIALPDALPLKTLETMGVARVSLGPFLFKATMGTMIEVIDQMKDYGDYSVFADRFPEGGLDKYLK